jgi:hypothetical protein
MQKILLAAFVAVVSLTANAQLWVGGELGYNYQRTTNHKVEVGKANNFSILPEIGYKLNDKIDVAVEIGFLHGEDGAKMMGHTVGNDQYANAFILNPYLRYTFAKAGNFSFFADGGFTYGNIHICGDDNSINAWQIAIKPGISYALSPKVSLVAHVGSAGWQFAKQGDVKTNSWGCGVSGNNITFGAYVNL